MHILTVKQCLELLDILILLQKHNNLYTEGRLIHIYSSVYFIARRGLEACAFNEYVPFTVPAEDIT